MQYVPTLPVGAAQAASKLTGQRSPKSIAPSAVFGKGD